MSTKLNDQDWLRLKDYNGRISRSIMDKLPPDWYLSFEEVQGAVYDSIIALLRLYRPGTQSATSYVYQYAEKYTLRNLLREYSRMKRSFVLGDCSKDETEDREYGECEEGTVKELTVDGASQMEKRAAIKDALGIATPEDRKIMELILSGYSVREVAKRFGTNKDAIYQRLRTYGKILEGVRK